MAAPRRPRRKAERYRHDEEALLRRDAGTEPQFRKELEHVKRQAAERGVRAVDADGAEGR